MQHVMPPSYESAEGPVVECDNVAGPLNDPFDRFWWLLGL
jgi:hypothetical protein